MLAEIDGLAIEHAGDVERADPVTGGLYGVLPTQGGMVSRLLRIMVSASNTNWAGPRHPFFTVRGGSADFTRSLRAVTFFRRSTHYALYV